MTDGPAPPGASYPTPPDGGRPAPATARPAPPAPPPTRANRRVIAATVGVAAALVVGLVGVGLRAMGSSPGHSSSPASTYQVPGGPAGRIDVTLSGGINDHFAGPPGDACGTVGIGGGGTQLLQVDTANSARTIQLVIQVVPYRSPGTFTAPAQVRGLVNYRPTTGGVQVLNARSGQVHVSSNGGKLSGRFDLQLSASVVQATYVTGTFSCG